MHSTTTTTPVTFVTTSSIFLTLFILQALHVFLRGIDANSSGHIAPKKLFLFMRPLNHKMTDENEWWISKHSSESLSSSSSSSSSLSIISSIRRHCKNKHIVGTTQDKQFLDFKEGADMQPSSSIPFRSYMEDPLEIDATSNYTISTTTPDAAVTNVANNHGSYSHNQFRVQRGGAGREELLERDSNRTPRVLFHHDLLHRLKIASYFILWYALNVIYNIVNKRVLNVLPAPLIIGTLQFGIGGVYAALLWIFQIRPFPLVNKRFSPNPSSSSPTSPAAAMKNSLSLRDAIWKVGFYHSTGQLLSMISLGAGPVSFTHIVKALEPFFAAIVSALISQKWMPWQVYSTLIPVVGGVGYACLKERSFSWLAFWTAMASNLAFALRAVVSKNVMTTSPITPLHQASTSIFMRNEQQQQMQSTTNPSLSSANLFALITWAAFFLSIPMALIGEGSSFFPLWENAVRLWQQRMIVDISSGLSVHDHPTVGDAKIHLMYTVVLSGLFHYLNNEVMYLALDNVHPVTLAVGNTMKRVFIMVASVLVFQNPVSLQAAIGSTVGIFGVLLYSLTKQYYERSERISSTSRKK